MTDQAQYSSMAAEPGADMRNPDVNHLYGGYNPFYHKKCLVLDRELDLYKPTDYIMQVGAPDRSYTKIASQTQASITQSNFILQTTLQTLLSANLKLHYKLYFNFGGIDSACPTLNNVYSDLVSGYLFLRPFPLQQSTSTYVFTFGGTSITVQLSQVINTILRCYPQYAKNKYLSQVPSYQDERAVWVSPPLIADPNNKYGNFGSGHVMGRNITDFNFRLIPTATVAANCRSIEIELFEPVLVDPFSLTRNGKPCLNGVNTYQWQFNYGSYQNVGGGTPGGTPTNGTSGLPNAISNVSQLTRAFCVVGGTGAAGNWDVLFNNANISFTPTGSNFGVTPELWTIQYSQVQRFPLFDNYSYPYSDISSGYTAQTPAVNSISTLATGSLPYTLADPSNGANGLPTVLSMVGNSSNLLQVPKQFIIWGQVQDAFKTAATPDFFLVPQAINLQFQTTPSLLSSAYITELFELSVKNGLDMIRATADNVGYPLILNSCDLGIPSPLMIEGVIASYQFQIVRFDFSLPKYVAPSSTTVNNLQLCMIPVYSAEIQVSNSRANLVCVAKVLPSEVPSFQYVDPDNVQSAGVNDMQGGSPLGWIKSHASKLRHMMSEYASRGHKKMAEAHEALETPEMKKLAGGRRQMAIYR